MRGKNLIEESVEKVISFNFSTRHTSKLTSADVIEGNFFETRRSSHFGLHLVSGDGNRGALAALWVTNQICRQGIATKGSRRAYFGYITVLGIATYLAPFVSAIQSGFQNYFNFKGRACRSEFWWWLIFTLTHQLPTLVIYSDTFNFAGLGYYFRLVVLVPTTAVAVRRMHDTNYRGWWILFPLVNLVLIVKKGDAEQNRFGLSPKPERSLKSSP